MTVLRGLRTHVHGTDDSHRVTSLELFFDLVFVFALTQLTAFLGEDLTAPGLVRGLVLLGLLWFGWTAFAWLGNQAKADEGLLRLGLVLAMMALFVAALALPEAYADRPGGLYAPAVFAVAYVGVRLVHLGVYAVAAGQDAGLRRQLRRTSVPWAVAALLLLAGAFAHDDLQLVLWGGALVADYAGVWLTGTRGWRVNSASHFAERHGLIIIVALGESIVALGVGAAGLPLSWPVLLGVGLGLAVAVALWWMYFDVVSLVAEGVLLRSRGEARARLARDSYTYLHLPMVAGIVLLALGLKKLVAQVADGSTYSLTDPLECIALAALYGGVVLYLVGHIAFRRRNVHSWNRQRIVAAAALLVLLPLAAELPALVALTVLTAVLGAVVAYEWLRFHEARERVRHQPGHGAGDAAPAAAHAIPAQPSEPAAAAEHQVEHD